MVSEKIYNLVLHNQSGVLIGVFRTMFVYDQRHFIAALTCRQQQKKTHWIDSEQCEVAKFSVNWSDTMLEEDRYIKARLATGEAQ